MAEPEVKLETEDLENVPIFSVGKWEGRGSKSGGDDITADYLSRLVTTFDAVGAKVKPRMILSHDKKESERRTGSPSIGWITGLRTDGKTLFANIKQIPKKIASLMRAKAYGRFSPGIFPKLDVDGVKYENVIDHVALLGGELPADMGIDGLIDLYETTSDEIIIYNQVDTMPEIKELEARIVELESSLAKATDGMKARDDENAKLAAYVKKVEADKKAADVDAYINKQLEAKKIIPAQVDFVKALLLGEGEMKTYGAAKGSDMDLVKGIIENAQSVDFSQQTQHEEPKKKTERANDGDVIDEKVKEYRSKHAGVSYSEAFSIVTRGE